MESIFSLGPWTWMILAAILFAAILIFIMIGGSLWIMLDLQHRMMT